MQKAINSVALWNEIAENTEYNRHLEASMLAEEFAELIVALKEWDKREAVDWLLDVFWVWIWTLYKLWIHPDDINRAWEEIQDSNFSKFSKWVDWESIAIKDSTWKILKPTGFKAPDLSFIKD